MPGPRARSAASEMVERSAARVERDAEGTAEHTAHPSPITNLREVGEDRTALAVGKPGKLEGEGCLADARRPEEGDEGCTRAELRAQLGEVGVASIEG